VRHGVLSQFSAPDDTLHIVSGFFALRSMT
jgi:hypothetical protein